MITNLTPHPIVIHPNGPNGAETITIPTSDLVALVDEEVEVTGTVDRVPVAKVSYGRVHNLPSPVNGQFFVVSALAAEVAYHSGRGVDDLLIVGEHVRDDRGRIIGSSCLVTWEPMLSRRGFLMGLRHYAMDRYRMEQRAELPSKPADNHIVAAAAVAECLVIGLSDPGEFGQTLHLAVSDAVTVGFQAIANALISERRRATAAEERRERARRETEQ